MHKKVLISLKPNFHKSMNKNNMFFFLWKKMKIWQGTLTTAELLHPNIILYLRYLYHHCIPQSYIRLKPLILRASLPHRQASYTYIFLFQRKGWPDVSQTFTNGFFSFYYDSYCLTSFLPWPRAARIILVSIIAHHKISLISYTNMHCTNENISLYLKYIY